MSDYVPCPLQGIIYCVVQLLGKNDPLLHALRQYARCRIMIGMACMTEDRLERLEKYVQSYGDLCIVRSFPVYQGP
jgi:hypothetical protein